MHVARAIRRAIAVARPPTHTPLSLTARMARLPAYETISRSFAQQSKTEGISTEPPADEKVAADGAGSESSEAMDPVKVLQDEKDKLTKSVAELNSTRLRLLADMENVRTIAKRDVDSAKAYALQSFAKRLLDVVDNLSRAVEAVPEASRTKGADPVLSNLYEGVSATHRSLVKTLAEFGISSFGVKGDKFDPNKFEAMLQVPASADAKADHIAFVLKSGFTLKDRVLRPAQVAVAVEGGEATPSS
jgi:molecular chaperone GrpE